MHSFDIRIYYEDTDAGGVVYHANYLNFMERARTEALREHGFESHSLAESENMVFALARTDLAYKRPAFLDDLVRVESSLREVKGARLVFEQNIFRDDILLVTGHIVVVTITKEGRPTRIPEHVKARLSQEIV